MDLAGQVVGGVPEPLPCEYLFALVLAGVAVISHAGMLLNGADSIETVGDEHDIKPAPELPPDFGQHRRLGEPEAPVEGA